VTTYYLDPSGNDGNAGTSPGSGGAWLTFAHAATVLAAGDTVLVKGVAGNAASFPTSSLDYASTGNISPSNHGDTTSGWIKWVRDPSGPVPTIGAPGLWMNVDFIGYHWFEGLYVVQTGTTYNTYGTINSQGPQLAVRNCMFNTANNAGAVGVKIAQGEVTGTVFYGGTNSPAFNSGSHLLAVAGEYGTLVQGNTFLYSLDRAISASGDGGPWVLGNLIFGCQGDAVVLSATRSDIPFGIIGNTIDSGAANAITLSQTAGASHGWIANNILSNHTGSGKYGINVTDGSAGTNDARKRLCDYNCLYNNTANYNNISAGAHDLVVNPSYANPGSDWTPTNAALKAAFPGQFAGTSSTSHGWIGAVQPAGGAAGMLVFPGLGGD
jgi:hypothetical protein